MKSAILSSISDLLLLSNFNILVTNDVAFTIQSHIPQGTILFLGDAVAHLIVTMGFGGNWETRWDRLDCEVSNKYMHHVKKHDTLSQQ